MENMEIIKTETIEHACCYNDLFGEDSVTVTLRKYFDSYEVVYETPDCYYVFGENCIFSREKAEEIYSEHVDRAKMLAQDRSEWL